MTRIKSTLLILVLVALSGCQTVAEKKQSNLLEDTLRQYAATLRWGSMNQVVQYHQDPAAPSSSQDAGTVRVIKYEVIMGPTMLSEDKALQVALIQYVFEFSQVVKELQHQQIWLYDETTKAWQQQSPPPEFR